MDQWINGPMDQWTNGPMDQWTNGPMNQWTNGPTNRPSSLQELLSELTKLESGNMPGKIKGQPHLIASYCNLWETGGLHKQGCKVRIVVSAAQDCLSNFSTFSLSSRAPRTGFHLNLNFTTNGTASANTECAFLSHYLWQGVWWRFSFVFNHEIWWNVKVCYSGKSLCESTTAGKLHLLWRLLSLSLPLWLWLWRMHRPWGDPRDVNHHNHFIIIIIIIIITVVNIKIIIISISIICLIKGAPWNQRCLRL